MFPVGHIWENVYELTDVVLDEKKDFVKRSVNVALHDILAAHAWPGYRASWAGIAQVGKTIFLPADIARIVEITIEDSDGDRHLPKQVTWQQREDARWEDKYRIAFMGFANYPSTVATAIGWTMPPAYPMQYGPSTVDLADGSDSMTFSGTTGFDATLHVNVGQWILIEDELNPRSTSWSGSGGAAVDLTEVYRGPARSAAAYTLDPSRTRVLVFAPGDTSRTEGLTLHLDYIRRPVDLLHKDQVVNLHNAQLLEYRAAAKLLRRDKRRDDASHYTAEYYRLLEQAKADEMQYLPERSDPPTFWNGNQAQFGGGTAANPFSPLSS